MNDFRRGARFALIVLLMALLVTWVGRTAWKELRDVRGSFLRFTNESFHQSDFIEEQIRTMEQALLDKVVLGDASSRAKFEEAGALLQERLRKYREPDHRTQREKDLVVRMSTALEIYLSKAKELMQEPAGKADSRSLLGPNGASAPLHALCRQFTEAEREGLVKYMQEAHNSLSWLESMLAISLTLLLVLVVVITLSGYRELLLPLRSQLRKSRAVIERHEKLASLGTLAAGVAHEIRNPLTAINVRVHGLKRNLAQGSSEHEDATVIASEIKRLEGIVQAFLQFARPVEPKFAIVAADLLLARVRTLMSGQLEKQGIELVQESPPDLWVRADPLQIEQVLINLVQNAAESIGQNGVIRLRARSASGRLEGRAQPVVLLEVIDTGKGIPPEVQKRLFDPFFTTKEEGTGLGLCIASRIVEQQGGNLQYTTQVNRGTTFSILLPETRDGVNESGTEDIAG